MSNIFYTILNNIISLYIPLFVISDKRNNPWVTGYVKRIIRTRQRKWNKFNINKTRANEVEYRDYCKFVHTKVIDARSRYEKNKFEGKDRNTKEFFNYVDARTNVHHGVGSLKVNNVDLTCDFDKATALSDQYKYVFTHDNGIIPPHDQRVPLDSLTDIQINDKMILDAVCDMNVSGSPGLDGIHPRLIKSLCPYLIKPLKYMFKASLASGTLPQGWTDGVIVPVYKCNNNNNTLY
jgi:hypothetical protein